MVRDYAFAEHLALALDTPYGVGFDVRSLLVLWTHASGVVQQPFGECSCFV